MRALTLTRARIVLTVLKTGLVGIALIASLQEIDSLVEERNCGLACATCHYCRLGVRRSSRAAGVGIEGCGGQSRGRVPGRIHTFR